MHPNISRDPLLQPLKLRGLLLRNRIVSTAHVEGYVERGIANERYIKYHEEKARGGVGLTIAGGSASVAIDSPALWGQIDLSKDSVIPGLSELTRRVKCHGTAIFCQITHSGRRNAPYGGDWLPLLSASPIPEPTYRAAPKEMEDFDFERVLRAFGDAARRCELGGFDGIELLIFGHLLGQFLTPTVNRRTDEFGGSLHNRMRLTVLALQEIRRATSAHMIVGVRMPGDELAEGGLTASDCIAVAKTLQDLKLIDYLNINGGQPFTELGLAEWVPSMSLPSALHLPVAAVIKGNVELPVLHAGGINDLATARNALREGLVDMVGMTRAHIADPYLVRKLIAGQEERIRPCVGLGYCIDRAFLGAEAVCGHNAATGRESTIPQDPARANAVRNITVVGAGPAGLEAARVAAARGHTVSVFEASDRVGGQLTFASRASMRRQIEGVISWLKSEVDRLGVQFIWNTLATPHDVLATKPDVVIVATGGIPRIGAFEGADLATPLIEILASGSSLPGEVILYDEAGDHAGASCAHHLAEMGSSVTFVTPDRWPMRELGPTTAPVYLREFYKLGISVFTSEELHSITRDGSRLIVSIRNTLTKQVRMSVVDKVAIELGAAPHDDLYHQLKPLSRNGGEFNLSSFAKGTPCFVTKRSGGKFDLMRIGDAVAGRNLPSAIFDGARIGLAV